MRIKCILIALLCTLSTAIFAQCEIQSRVYPDGSLLYSMAPVKFYWTEAKELYGGVVTDKEHFFLSLQPIPFPEKPAGIKLKDNLLLTLSNQQKIELTHYDTRYMQNDSIMEMLFLLDKKDLEAAYTYEASSVKMNMGEEEGYREYHFKLHKTAFQDQLACFLEDKSEKIKE